MILLIPNEDEIKKELSDAIWSALGGAVFSHSWLSTSVEKAVANAQTVIEERFLKRLRYEP